jgi:uncharacterized protein
MTTILNDTLQVAREAPQPFSFSRPYWEATREKKLLIQFCPSAGQYQFHPRPVSVFTGKSDLEWREVSGTGEVFTFTVAWRGPGPFRSHEPYLIATVTLDEGVNIIGNVVNCSYDDIHIGMRVKPFWAPLPGGMHHLMFEPDPNSAKPSRPAADAAQIASKFKLKNKKQQGKKRR